MFRILAFSIFVLVNHPYSVVSGGKETLRQQLEQVITQGKKIAIVLPLSKVNIVPKEGSPAICPMVGGGMQDIPKEFQKVAQVITEQLSNGFELTDIEWVDLQIIPDKKQVSMAGNSYEQHDWRNTDYGIVVYVGLALSYDPHPTAMSTRLLASLGATFYKVDNSLPNLEPLTTFKSLGYASTEYVNHPNCIGSLIMAEGIVGKPIKVLNAATEEAQEKLARFIDKENKKYLKATKK